MTYIEAVKTCMRKYIDFSGRAARSEFWWFILFTIIVGFVLGFLAGLTGNNSVMAIAQLIPLIFVLPTIAVAVRRLHDIDKSGWFYLLILIPIVGPILLIYWFVQPGTVGPNRFGV